MKHRCKNCNKQLAQGIFSGTIAIKCPRCKTINQLDLSTPNAHERHSLEHETHGQDHRKTAAEALR